MIASVCIASFNRDPAVLRRTLASVCRQSPPFNFEVILVDDGSEYGAPDVYREFPVRYAKIDRRPVVRDPAVARNVAYRMAYGDIIIAQSDEVEHQQNNSIEVLCDTLVDNPDSFVIATVFGCNEAGQPEKVYTGRLGNDRRHLPLFFLGALWRHDLYSVGGNDEDFAKGDCNAHEDKWFAQCLMQGLHLTPYYTDKVVGHHLWHPRRVFNKQTRPNARLYQQKVAAAERSGHWCASGGPWLESVCEV